MSITEADRTEVAAIRAEVERMKRYHPGSAPKLSIRDVELLLRLAEGHANPQGALADATWEYGWRSFFSDGEEYFARVCASVTEARSQAAELQKRELWVREDGRLTYSVWRRRVDNPWEPVEADL